MAYTPAGSEDCFACIGEFLEYHYIHQADDKLFHFNSVVGFLNPSFSGFEQEPGHSVPVGYLKGGTVAGQNLVFDVRSTPDTASESLL
jgi:hypothetical protein